MSGRSCYYPNGNLSESTDIPCGDGDGVACCPVNWACRSNGLCYLASEGFYGRYTCTDATWVSDGCPQICTYDTTASGNEAIQLCESNSWCCDTNRPRASCCDTTRERFTLDDSKEQRPMENSGSSSDSGLSSLSASDTPLSSASATPESTSSVIASVTAGDNGITTIYVTSTAATANHFPSHTPLASIVAPAVAVPLFLLSLVGLIAFLIIRRHRQQEIQNGCILTTTDAVPMYKEEVPPTSPNAPSEMGGSLPTMAWHRQQSPTKGRFETPSDVGTSSISTSPRYPSMVSPLSQIWDPHEVGITELPVEQDNGKGAISEPCNREAGNVDEPGGTK